jgi:hypothetical protein
LCSVAFDRYLQAMACSVLLDLDDTLIDSQPGILASCLAALRALGHEPDETLDIRHAIGPRSKMRCNSCCNRLETTGSPKPSLPIGGIMVKWAISEACLIRELANPLKR